MKLNESNEVRVSPARTAPMNRERSTNTLASLGKKPSEHIAHSLYDATGRQFLVGNYFV
jgi:hypothetical protein